MPIVGTAKKVMDSMVSAHGGDTEKAKRMFYATANKLNRRPEDWSKKEGAALGPMSLPAPGGQRMFHVTGPANADPGFIGRQASAIAQQHAAHGAKLVREGIVHPDDLASWHANSMKAILGAHGITAHPIEAGEPTISGSHFPTPPAARLLPAGIKVPETTSAYAKSACAEMGPWTIIDAETAAPVTVECKFDYGQGDMGFIGTDDGCYTIYVSDGAGRYTKTTHIFPEAMDALHTLPVNPAELSIGCGPMIAPMGDSDAGLHGENSPPMAPTIAPQSGGPVGIPQDALTAAGKQEYIPGGPAEGVPDEAVPEKPLENGAKIEAMEHTEAETPKDLAVGKEIAKDHLVAKGDEAEKEYTDEKEEKTEKETKKKAPKIEAMEEAEPKDEKKEAASLIAPY